MATPIFRSLLACVMLVHALIGCLYCCDHHHHEHSPTLQFDAAVLAPSRPIGPIDSLAISGQLIDGAASSPAWDPQHSEPHLHKCTCAFRQDPATTIQELVDVQPSLLADPATPVLSSLRIVSASRTARAAPDRPSAQEVRAQLQVWLI